MSDIKDTIPGVYIIESLDFSDEARDISEGKMIKMAMKLCQMKCTYKYIRTTTEFKHFLSNFRKRKYRYLHISCHGSKTGIQTTLDEIPVNDLLELLPKNMDNRRLFISACGIVNDNVAKKILNQSDCFSIIGYDESININDSAMFWASFYYAIFRQHMQMKERFRMSREDIIKILSTLARLFELKINYYAYKETQLIKCIIQENGESVSSEL